MRSSPPFSRRTASRRTLSSLSRIAALILVAVSFSSDLRAQQDLLNADGKLDDSVIVVYDVLGSITAASMRALIDDTNHYVVDLGAKNILFDLSTPGGDLGAALLAAKHIHELRKKHNIRALAFVPQKTRLNAATLLAFACEYIAMSDDTLIGNVDLTTLSGDSDTRPEDIAAALRGFAVDNGFSEKIADAMVDPSFELVEITGVDLPKELQRISTKREYNDYAEKYPARPLLPTRPLCVPGELLALNERDARRIAISRNAATVEHFLTDLGILGKPVEASRLGVHGPPIIDSEWMRILDHHFIKFLLIVIGVIGLALEFHMMGTLVPGLIGLAAFAMYFWIGYVYHRVVPHELLIFALGVVLIGLELFVIPGFGIAGLLGFGSVFASLAMTWETREEITLMTFYQDSIPIAVGLTVGMVGLILIMRFWPTSSRSGVVTSATLSGPATVPGIGTLDHLLGRRGIVVTSLRPSGKAEFDGREYDVVARGEMIERNTPVQVTLVEGNRIVVESLHDEDDPSVDQGSTNGAPV